MFRPQKTFKKTRIQLYNTLALPVLLYGSESWTIKARDARRITAVEMKYTKRTAGYTWTDYKTNTQIAKELKITPVLLYGSETWTVKARDARRITAAEMKYMRRTAGYTRTYYKTNTQIANELKLTPVLDKLLEYKETGCHM